MNHDVHAVHADSLTEWLGKWDVRAPPSAEPGVVTARRRAPALAGGFSQSERFELAGSGRLRAASGHRYPYSADAAWHCAQLAETARCQDRRVDPSSTSSRPGCRSGVARRPSTRFSESREGGDVLVRSLRSASGRHAGDAVSTS